MYRHFAPLLLLATLALAPTTVLAQEAKADAMPAWDQLTPAQRELLIAPVRDRWNREPEKRERFMAYAERWKAMPQPQRERARHGMQRWEGMTPEAREQARAVFHVVRGLDKHARGEFMEKWRQMTPQQRTDWVKTHPAPERRDGD